MLGLAEHFAKVPQSQRRRTMVFIGTDGHHANQPGGYGAEWLAANREKFFSKTALMINAEHPSQVLTHGGDRWMDGNHHSPSVVCGRFIEAAARRRLPSTRFMSSACRSGPSQAANPPGGDMAHSVGFLPGVVVQSNDFMYMHTTGDTPENVAWSGLEAATRAYARIIDEVNKLALSDLQRPLEQDPNAFGAPRAHLESYRLCGLDRDSSASCKPRTEH